MKPDYVTLLETEYVAKILGFAYQKLNDRSEVEDLASDNVEAETLKKEQEMLLRREIAMLAAYEEPATIKELCVELGVSAAYIEDEVAALVENQLLKEVSRGKYQTDFVVLPGDNSKMLHKIYENCFPVYYDNLMAFLTEHKELLSAGNFNLSGFTWERLLWVYIHMFTEFALDNFRPGNCKTVMYQDMAQGFFHYWSGTSSTPFFELPSGMLSICSQVAKNSTVSRTRCGILQNGRTCIFKSLEAGVGRA